MNVNDIKLFPHNQDTYNKIQETWKTSNKVASVQATGTGKSYLILKCLYNEADKNKIVLAPSNYILEQLESEAGETLPNTILMTYADLSINTEDKLNNLDNIDLIVLDEFHRCGAEQWGSGVQKLIEAYPSSKILGTSATNIRFLDNNRDMADELFDGNVVNNLSLAEAIVKKILPMPKYISALYTFSNEIENLKNKVNNSKNTDEEKEKLLKEIDKMKNKLDKSKGIPQIFKKHLNTNSNDKFIVFCKDGQHLNEMKEVVTNWFKKAKITKNIDIYTAYTGYNNTDKEVKEFKNNKEENTIKLLFSIDMFNEGIHIKDVSGVILLRPTVSPTIYYQQIGRAIQVGKEDNPLIFDFVNNFDNIGAKNFISDLKEYTRQQREFSNSDKDNNEFNQDDIEFMIFDEIQEAKGLFEQLEEKLIGAWDEMYQELKQYYIINKNCNVINEFDNEKLYNWVRNQRKLYAKNQLVSEKIIKLEEINFIWNKHNLLWDTMFQKLVEYKNTIKDFNENTRVEKDNSFNLWLKKQRINYINKIMPQERIDKFNSIGIYFEEEDPRWMKKYKEYVQYINNKNQIEIADIKNWMKKQRNLYNKNILSKNKIELLNKTNFVWDQSEEKWNKMYNYLKDYKEKYNNIKVPKNYKTPEGYDLCSWMKHQKAKFNKAGLSKKQMILFSNFI